MSLRRTSSNPSSFIYSGHGIETHLDEQQLLESGERGVRAADDDCLRNLDLRRGLPSRSWLRSGDRCARESLRPFDALSGLKLSLRARRSPSSPSGLSAGCESRRPTGRQDSSKAVACRCRRCRRGRSGLALESRLLTRPHCVVESRRPGGAVGLVAGGVTLLMTIVGGGSAWHPVSTWLTLKYGPESEAVELVDGRCSCRKFGSSATVSESRRFFVAPTTLGGGGVTAATVESRRPLR